MLELTVVAICCVVYILTVLFSYGQEYCFYKNHLLTFIVFTISRVAFYFYITLLPLLMIHNQNLFLPPPLAHIPSGAVQGVGQPREHAGGPSGSWSAGEELSDIQGPGCQDAVPAEMARHRRQRQARDQDLCKDTGTACELGGLILYTLYTTLVLYIRLHVYDTLKLMQS